MKKLSFLLKASITAIFLLLPLSAAFGQSRELRSDLGRRFTKFDVVTVNSRQARRAADAKRSITLMAEGKSFALALEPRNLMSARYRAVNQGPNGAAPLTKPRVNTFKGKVAGDGFSEVRLTLDGKKIEGYFTTGFDRFFVEPARKYSDAAGADDLVVYRAEDAVDPVTFECRSELIKQMERGNDIAAASLPEDAESLQALELTTDADFEYVTTLGGVNQANAEILSIINMVEPVYESQLGITFSVNLQHTWTTADPFTGANDDAYVRNLAAYWEQNFPRAQNPRDAMHLFTGDADKLGRGFAFIGVICRTPSLAYGFSGYVNFAPGKFLLTAHEMGHNFGANHVSGANGADCANSLMIGQLQFDTPLSFCQFSRTEIGNYLASNNACLNVLTTTFFDFDGDGRSDISVFRPSEGNWYANQSRAGFLGLHFGQNGDQPVPADYDGDGKADIAVFRGGTWYRLLSGNGTFDGVNFGLAGDRPVPGDFDGDGKADVAVFRPSDGNWYQMLSATGAFFQVHFGASSDVPVPADFDGDGKADVNVYRPSEGNWYRLNSRDGSFFGLHFGIAEDKPIAGDFDGDAKADIVVYRPSNGSWYIMPSLTGVFYGLAFGISTDIPSAGDFDGDGKSDISVFRPSEGTWYRLNSRDGSFYAEQFGAAEDKPIPAYYVP
jgi:hypothetical protein